MPKELNVVEIMELLPHRYPFLMVDKITDWTENSITGLKNVTINEPFFQGHFPGHPIMPGVLQVEGIAQCAGCLLFQRVDHPKNYVVYFMGLDKVKFRKPVFPGMTIIYNVEVLSSSGSRAKIRGTVSVDGKVCCEGEMMAMIMPREGAGQAAGDAEA
jgi:beta-hydroxyacyl-ACP dehydratase FabZ